MHRPLFGQFKFSPVATVIGVVIAALMLRASAWQWSRYKEKVKLLESYAANAGAPPAVLPEEGPELSAVMNRKVALEGDYDFERQMIVLNRRHITGPGFWLLTPLRMASGKAIIVSRGFIPFGDDVPEKWSKYDSQRHVRIEAVVQKTVSGGFLKPDSSDSSAAKETFIRRWYYPDIQHIAAQLPYPTYHSIYVQRIAPESRPGPSGFSFPAEAISVGVPPTTHFGYTIEWILLALATLGLSFAWQAFPWFFRRRSHDATNGIQNTNTLV